MRFSVRYLDNGNIMVKGVNPSTELKVVKSGQELLAHMESLVKESDEDQD